MPPDTDISPKHSDTVSCHPSAVYWVFVPFCAVFGVMAWFGAHNTTKTGPPSAADVAFVQTCAAALLITAVGLSFWLIRARIIADERGLRWRRFGGWKSACWEEVEDFYDRLPNQSQRRPAIRAEIRTSVGKITFSSEWSRTDALRAMVTVQATNAAVTEWYVLGSRPCDPWPQVFHYNTWQNAWTPSLLGALLVAFLVFTLARPISRTVNQMGTPGWEADAAMLAVFVVLIFSKGSLMVLLIARYRAAGSRRGERITADPSGIVFEDGARRVEAAWADVTGYGVAYGRNALLSRYVVEARQGDFDFLGEISQGVLLMVIIQRYAVEAADKKWRSRIDFETLGGEVARWSGGRVGVGARVYHYQTRTNRALLWLPLSLCVMCGLLAVLSWQGLTPGTPPAAGTLGIAAMFGLILLGGWYGYRVCRLETDEDGLTQVTPFARRRLAWAQVNDYWLTGEYNTGVVQGHGECLRFSSSIVGYEELKEEIARRATECGGKAWTRKGTPRRNPALKGRAK